MDIAFGQRSRRRAVTVLVMLIGVTVALLTAAAPGQAREITATGSPTTSQATSQASHAEITTYARKARRGRRRPVHRKRHAKQAKRAKRAKKRAAKKKASTAATTVPAAYAAFAGTTKQTQSWWNKADYPRGKYVSDAYLWPDFPQPCNPDPAADAIQFLWIHPSTSTSTLPANLGTVRAAAAAAASAFTASAQRYVASQAQYYQKSLAPRYVTTGSGSSCTLSVADVAIPYLTWITDAPDPSGSSTGDDGPFSGNGIAAWLRAHGYNASNRKYVALVQGGWPVRTAGLVGTVTDLLQCVLSPSSCGWSSLWDAIGGITSRVVDDLLPSYANPSNDPDTFSFVSMAGVIPGGIGMPEALGHTIAHEMVHSLGGLMASDPHDNSHNVNHPTDCGDLLCYGPGTPGENWGVCTSPAAADRLDCDHDDYFAPSTQNADGSWRAAPAWTRTRWSISGYSTYLYGTSPSQAATDVARMRP